MFIRRAAQTVLLSLSLLSAARADDPAALVERLHQAEASTSLDAEGLQPWHLKLEVQLFDKHGKPSEGGTIEEWWNAPDIYQIAYALPSYNAIEARKGPQYLRTKTATTPPSVLKLLLGQVVHPMPSSQDVQDTTPDLRKQDFGKVPLECIMLNQQIKGVNHLPLGFFPTYCFDPGKTSLRLVSNFGTQVVIRNSTGAFLARTVSTNITVRENNVEQATAQVGTLESKLSMAPPDLDWATIAPISHEVSTVAPAVMAGHLIVQVPPVYPEGARSRRATGKVLLSAKLGTDGRVHTLRVLSAPDPDLAVAALDAVRQWQYTPYLLLGEPVEVDTKITVNFEIH
jgi:TonB family protein